MLNLIYRLGRLFLTKGWIVGLIVGAVTIVLGTYSFLNTQWPNGAPLGFPDALRKAISLLSGQAGDSDTAGNTALEISRWLGLTFWFSTLTAVGIKLLREPVHRILVKLLAHDHILIAGLGHQGVRLVEALRKQGKTVVIIESNKNHHGVDTCRELGAIVLFGDSDDERMLLAANLSLASTILALFPEERICVRTVVAVNQILSSKTAKSTPRPLRCVLRLTEPGLLDVMRKHRIKLDPTDRIQLEILNSHEIAATTMLREALAHQPNTCFRSILVLGLGALHRLGEMVILRAAKDHLIFNDGKVLAKLLIDVCDKDAGEWLEAFRGRYPFVDQVCTIRPLNCLASKAGPVQLGNDYDAGFVCIPDEGHATAQGVMLRGEVLTRDQPIMIRVQHSGSGHGELINDPISGWGFNMHAVGLEDSLFDPDMATKPEMELRAQTIHQDYRARTKGIDKKDIPWIQLQETHRESNRELAKRYSDHLAFTDGKGKIRPYRWDIQPETFTQMFASGVLLFQFSNEELEVMAAREHQLWKEEREKAGWIYGPIKDQEKKQPPFGGLLANHR